MTGWTERTGMLADELAAAGHLPDPRWRQAFAAVPRQVFVPRFHRNDNTIIDGANPIDRDEWLAAVYSDTSLVTQNTLVPGTDLHWPTSSSTRPSLMARMLHLLAVTDGHRVLEIGTGTGYDAALLCHRLGDGNVASVDIDAELVDTARTRLACLGYRPYLRAGDGVAGLPERAPYDRIIATCAISSVPSPWIGQLDRAGVIVADVRGELSSSLAVLNKIGETAVEGRFLAVPGHFMWLRAMHDHPLRDGGSVDLTIDRDNATRGVTGIDPGALQHPDLRFLLQHLDPSVQQIWPTQRDGAELTVLHAGDGSWAEIDTFSRNGSHAVTQGGPRPLWNLIEGTTHLWSRLGRPRRDRFGLTATTDGNQRLWLDDPDGADSWTFG